MKISANKLFSEVKAKQAKSISNIRPVKILCNSWQKLQTRISTSINFNNGNNKLCTSKRKLHFGPTNFRVIMEETQLRNTIYMYV